MNNINNLGISMRNSADIQAHSISLIKDNRVVSLEDYITEIAGDGGGGNGNVDLSNYYTHAETDNLLNNKLNVNNPQDVLGTLRIDSTNGNGKLIVNAVGAPNDEDFYVNGLSNLGGTLKAQLIQANSNIETSQQIKSNTINTYSNMIIQRNAIPYTTLDSQIVDSQTVEKIILMKDVEFSGGLSLNTLSVDTLNTNALNDMVFNINTLGEMLRLEVGGTVRVPNTRSFISQNIFSDLIQPLTFSNDVVFNGGNSTNDAYEEYIRLDVSEETVNISKEVNASEDVVMQQTKRLYLDNTANLRRYITTRRDNNQDILELVNNKATNNQIRFTNNGSTSLIVDNSFLFSERQIQGNNGLKVDFVDTRNTNVSFQFRRAGSTLLTLNTSNQIQLSGDLSLPTSNTQYIRFPNCNIRQGVATVVYFDFNVDTATGQYRFFIDSNTILNSTQLTTTISNTLQVNTLNSSGDNDVVISRNNIPFLTLDKFTEDSVEKEAIICSKELRANAQLLVNKLKINQFPVSIEYADFRLEDVNNSILRFFVGNSNGPNLLINQYLMRVVRL